MLSRGLQTLFHLGIWNIHCSRVLGLEMEWGLRLSCAHLDDAHLSVHDSWLGEQWMLRGLAFIVQCALNGWTTAGLEFRCCIQLLLRCVTSGLASMCILTSKVTLAR
jgi:hypothetical protein